MADLVTAHTSDLDAATLAEARALLYDVFGDEMTEHDWEHALGGVHALLRDGDELIGHASLVMRRLICNGGALRTGYVEGVAVRAARRREGHGAALMDAMERVIEGAYEMGALGSTDSAAPFYASRGWIRWDGPTAALAPDGLQRTLDSDGSVFVFPLDVALDPSEPIVCDWRDGDPW